MTITVSIRDAKNRLTELARKVEAGEVVTVTRNGQPVFDIVPHKKKGGINFEAAKRWMDEHGYRPEDIRIAPDFDDPLPEDFLLQPLPDKK